MEGRGSEGGLVVGICRFREVDLGWRVKFI